MRLWRSIWAGGARSWRRALCARRSGRSPVVALAVLALSLTLAACGGTGSAAAPPRAATTTRPAKVTILPLATVRARYLAIVTPADKTFATFSTKLRNVNITTTNAALVAITRPAAAAVARSGRSLYALRVSTTPRIARALYAVVLSDNTVWQALQDLEAGWGSRSFDATSWQSAYVQALKTGNAAGAALEKALGITSRG